MYSVYEELIGKIIIKIDKCVNDDNNEDNITFYLSNGEIYELCHYDDCCESVSIEDINGDLDDLIGYKLIQAEESYEDDKNASESGTWSFYKFGTSKGYVTIRWYGTSNGYYSETASMNKIDKTLSIKELRNYKLCKIENIKKDSI